MNGGAVAKYAGVFLQPAAIDQPGHLRRCFAGLDRLHHPCREAELTRLLRGVVAALLDEPQRGHAVVAGQPDERGGAVLAERPRQQHDVRRCIGEHPTRVVLRRDVYRVEAGLLERGVHPHRGLEIVHGEQGRIGHP